MSPRITSLCLTVGAFACAPIATAGPGCAETASRMVLERELSETSGVAVGRKDPTVLWTHNDGDSDLYALDYRSGRLLGRFDVTRRLGDWEDLEIAPCVVGGSCLYLADTGDNGERRPGGQIRILRLAEPEVSVASAALGDGPVRSVEAEAFPVRLPDGPRDVEALFVLPGEVPYLVSKGADAPVTVYRYPPPLRPDTVTLVEVQRLTRGSVPLLDRVTGAGTSPDGSWIAIRTYQALQFYRMEADTLAAVEGGLVNLRILQEIQGEAVAIGPDGVLVLTSEGGPLGGPPSLRVLRCALGGA